MLSHACVTDVLLPVPDTRVTRYLPRRNVWRLRSVKRATPRCSVAVPMATVLCPSETRTVAICAPGASTLTVQTNLVCLCVPFPVTLVTHFARDDVPSFPAGPCGPGAPAGPVAPCCPADPCGPGEPWGPTAPCCPAGPAPPSLPWAPSLTGGPVSAGCTTKVSVNALGSPCESVSGHFA